MRPQNFCMEFICRAPKLISLFKDFILSEIFLLYIKEKSDTVFHQDTILINIFNISTEKNFAAMYCSKQIIINRKSKASV